MTTISATGRKKTRAFTLIELLLVLVIISVVAAVAVPSLRATAETVIFEESLRKVYCLSGLVQDLAQQKQLTHYLAIERRTGEFIAQYVNEQEQLKPVQASAARTFRLPDGITLITEPADIRGVYFYPDATSDRAILTFAGAAGKKLSIEFGGINGSISICEENKK